MEQIQRVLTDKKLWQSYYKGKNTFNKINRFINKHIFNKEILRYIQFYLADSEQKTLIEMGCGGSEWLVYINKKLGHKVYGIDYLESGCELARRKLKRNGIKDFEIYQGDFFTYDKELKSKFNYVVSFGVVEHFDPPSKLLGKFKNYLLKGGTIITTCPNTKGVSMNLQKKIDKKVYDSHLIFSLKDLIKYHEQAGFKVIFSAYLGFMSFNNLAFKNFPFFGRLLKIPVKLLNAPVVILFQLLKLQSKNWSSDMLVVARLIDNK